MKRVRLHSDLVSGSRWPGAMLIALVVAMTLVAASDAWAQGRRGGGRWGGGNFDPEAFREIMRQRMQERGGDNDGDRNDRDGRGGNDNDEDEDDNNNSPNQQNETRTTEPVVPPLERSTSPPRVPDMSELDFALDENGRVPPFGFRNQGWPEVMQWVAHLSDYSLDWQWMPSDYLDLTTEQPMSVDELRDLINARLLARGYTTLINGNVITVTRTDRIEPSLVPRISEDELYDRRPYEFVKVVFELPNAMQVENAPDDIAKLLSPNARVFPLVSTERVLVMDVVANLRTVSELLNEERSVGGVPREFMLRYARGEKVIETLYVILGINPDQQPQQQDMRLQRQRWEVMEEIAERGGDVNRALNAGPKVYLAHNQRRNSVLANAPPEQMRIIAQAIRYLDVPQGGASLAAWPSEGDYEGAAVPGTGQYLEKYQLVTTDPDKMVVTLSEVGGLSPWTEMRTDAATKTLFVRATQDDHDKISRLIDELDGTGRTFRVVELRTLPADAVAATIHQLMVGQEDEQQESSPMDFFRRGRGRGRDRGRNRQPEQTFDPTKGFRVTADVEQNRLLLWANPDEFAEVQNLLTQLGEIDNGRGGAPTFRVIDIDPQATERLMDQLRRTWTGDNPLIINPPAENQEGAAEQPSQEGAQNQPPADRTTSQRPAVGQGSPVTVSFVPLTGMIAQPTAAILMAQADASAAPSDAPPPGVAGGGDARNLQPSPSDEAPADAAPSAPPVKITTTPDGRIIVSSSDAEAMMRMEELIKNLTPRQKGFKVFRIKHVSASSVWYNLTDYFADELADSGEDDPPWWARIGQTDDQASGLSDRRGLRFIYDNVSNTVLVSGATDAQLNEIESLIDVFDNPSSADTIKNRRTAIIPVRYSQASVIATAVKDVYRDLLSARDRVFQADNGRGGGVSSTVARDTVLRYGLPNYDGTNSETPPMPVGFDGSLSVSVDEMANAVIISAEEDLFSNVVELVKDLDEQARRDTRVVVYQPTTNLDVSALQSTLQSMLAAPATQVDSRRENQDRNNNDRQRDNNRARERDNGGRPFQFERGNRGGGNRGGGFGGGNRGGGRGGDRGGR